MGWGWLEKWGLKQANLSESVVEVEAEAELGNIDNDFCNNINGNISNNISNNFSNNASNQCRYSILVTRPPQH